MSQSHDFCDKLYSDENIFINEADGLTNQHPILPIDSDDDDIEGDNSNENDSTIINDSETFDDLPTSLIVTNINPDVFTDDPQKEEIEKLFKFFSPTVRFQWFRSFKRLRVNFDTALAAATARIQLHQYQCGDSVISCYFAQPVTPVVNKYLKPPAPFKQFLISPPASPPAGWEPRAEGEPLVNHDLLAALANLTPGESHELHPQSTEHPGIIIHTAKVSGIDENIEIDNETDVKDPPIRGTIVQTKCPERS